MELRCHKCKKPIISGDMNGIPNGVGFEMENGLTINLCQNCLVELGSMTDTDRNKFFDEVMANIRATCTDNCWETGVYNSECNCEECSHKDECSGYNG